MEVYKCLHNIIEKVEKQEQIILKARGFHGQLIIIDLHQLKYNPRLEGAEIFKMLFGINDNSPFGNFPMQTDKNGYITLLQELMVSGKDWILFKIFLDQGVVPDYKNYLTCGSGYNSVSSYLEDLNNICTKFGGIPSFELFYNNFYNYQKEKKEKEEYYNYNPIKPEEDTKQLYQWGGAVYRYSSDLITIGKLYPPSKKWTLSHLRKDARSPPAWINIYRRKKSNIIQENEESEEFDLEDDDYENTDEELEEIEEEHGPDEMMSVMMNIAMQ